MKQPLSVAVSLSSNRDAICQKLRVFSQSTSCVGRITCKWPVLSFKAGDWPAVAKINGARNAVGPLTTRTAWGLDGVA